MSTLSNEKAPVARLAGKCDEGLSPTPTEKESTTMVPAAVPTRIALGGTQLDVQPVDDRVELTLSSFDHDEVRSTYGLALTRPEARRLADALLDGAAVARNVPARAVSPAKLAAARQRKEGR